jgi:hypothetical protein
MRLHQADEENQEAEDENGQREASSDSRLAHRPRSESVQFVLAIKPEPDEDASLPPSAGPKSIRPGGKISHTPNLLAKQAIVISSGEEDEGDEDEEEQTME